MLKEKVAQNRRRPPAAHAAVAAPTPAPAARLLRRLQPATGGLPPDIAEQLHVGGAPVAA